MGTGLASVDSPLVGTGSCLAFVRPRRERERRPVRSVPFC